MCAIVGIISNRNIEEAEEIFDMADIMLHRGPDAQGFAYLRNDSFAGLQKREKPYHEYIETKAILGFDRLAIRDISQNGMQPMISPDREVAIVFNGEIYNTDAMKAEISDYSFLGGSDTEVVLAYYLQNGIDRLLDILNGMFAICIIDNRIKKAYLFRDRMGIKPFYFTMINQETIAFASEIKAFLPIKRFDTEINLDALKEFFTFGDPVYGLLIKNVSEVDPGELITVELTSMKMSHRLFFDVNDFYHPSYTDLDEQKIEEILSNTLKECINRQFISDVTVGVQCSGGVDSSLVAYYASQLYPRNFKGGYR